MAVTPFDRIFSSDFGAAGDIDAGTVRSFLAGEAGPGALPEPEWGPLGKEVFERTYAREVPGPDGPRKETWAETVRRVVLGNLSYAPEGARRPDEDVRLFQLIYSLKAVPAGRHLWVTGVPSVSAYSRNCLARETEVITRQGVKKIGEIAGQSVEVLDGHGHWTTATARSFGVQALMKITLTRGKSERKEIFATADHGWFTTYKGVTGRHSVRCQTKDLKPRHRLASVRGFQTPRRRLSVSPVGVQHGFVFGDGTCSKDPSGSAAVYFCGHKVRDMVKWFPAHEIHTKQTRVLWAGGNPRSWKEVPPLTEAVSYLYGFLAGYFAADGSIDDKGCAQLHSASYNNLMAVRSICARLGIPVRLPHSQSRIGYGEEPSDMWSITIDGSALTEEFFLISEHRERWAERYADAHKHVAKIVATWMVESVESTDRVEEVFCFEVPTTHSFALAENILTSNCFVSGYGPRLSDHFSFLAARLFEGGGVGANYSADLRAVTPPVRGPVTLQIACRGDHPDIEAVREAAGAAFLGPEEMHDEGKANHAFQTALGARADDEARCWAVPDTREGWAGAWAGIIDLATGPGEHPVVLDVSGLRPYGAPLRRFGGKASGPAPFVRAALAIARVLSGAAGRQLSGLETMQIDHEIAASVIAGGSRRSARLALMHWRDPEISDFIACKSDQMSHWSANISVEIDAGFREALVAGDAHAKAVFEAVCTGMALNGEPGIIDTGLASETEPEPLRAVNPCLGGDVKLSTPDGPVPIKDLVSKPFRVWNGEEWAPATAWSTGVKPVYDVVLDIGASVRATADHVFATADNDGKAPVSGLLGRSVFVLGDISEPAPGDSISRVVSVTYAGEEEVFDFSEPKTHWGYANGVRNHNCGEAFLATDPADGAGEACNLGQVDLDAYGADMDGATEAVELMARFLYRSTLNPHPDEAARRIEARNRRIGVGIMGVQGWAVAHGYKLSELPGSEELLGKLTALRLAARRAADELADQLGTPRSVKVTAVAPTGTISNLRGTTPGPHPVFARYFVRRVRFAAHDPAWERLAAEGHEVVDDVYAAATKVVAFPMRDSVLDRHPDELIEQADELPVEQFLDLVAAVQATYCGGTDGQAVSATAQIPEGTSPAHLAEALAPRLGRLKGMTVFPAVSRALPPLETISAERYRELSAQVGGKAVGDSSTGCIGGACPIR